MAERIDLTALNHVGDGDYVHKDALKALEPALACCYEIAANGCRVDAALANNAINETWRLMEESATGMSSDSQPKDES